MVCFGVVPGCSHAGAADTSCPSLLSVPLPSPAPERGGHGFGATPETPKPRGGGEDAQELAGTDLVPRMRAGLGLLELDPQEEQGRVASLACLITCPAVCCSFFPSSRRNAWRDGRPLPSPSTGGIGLGLFGFVFHLRSRGSPRKIGRPKPTRDKPTGNKATGNKATQQKVSLRPWGKLRRKHRPRRGAQIPWVVSHPLLPLWAPRASSPWALGRRSRALSADV